MLDKFSQITNEATVKRLTDLNTVFVPNRSFSVYAGYDDIEKTVRRATDGKPFDAANRRTQHTEKPALPSAEGWDSDAEDVRVSGRN